MGLVLMTSVTQLSVCQLDSLRRRRETLAQTLTAPVILWSGGASSRNFPANHYQFRASSHFLYFAGLPIPRAALYIDPNGSVDLIMDPIPTSAQLWVGPALTPADWAERIQARHVYTWSDIQTRCEGAATLPVQDPVTRAEQVELLGRPMHVRELTDPDRALAEAIIQLRLSQDPGALEGIRQAVEVSIAAHVAGMAATPLAQTEAQVRAAIEGMMLAHNHTTAYNSIVTTHGEVLHNEQYHHALVPGDLLLVDAGSESPLGWASDITRTWPVSGSYSPTQRAIYDIVRRAHDACIEQAAPGVEYQELHQLAGQVMAAGLVDVGILRGDPQSLFEREAQALFFPHGVGHLLGLDVHDMEDLGDMAGYAPGRQRSSAEGLKYLRLNRPLQPGMVVTIEPGFYQVEGILANPRRREPLSDCVNWDRLAEFADVRGIRIEDDVLITATGCEVLTQALTTDPEQIERHVQQG